MNLRDKTIKLLDITKLKRVYVYNGRNDRKVRVLGIFGERKYGEFSFTKKQGSKIHQSDRNKRKRNKALQKQGKKK